MTCTATTEAEFRTCVDPEHHKLETYYNQHGKAMFQLKHQLEHAKISQTHDSLHPSGDDDDNIANLADVDEDDDNLGEGSGVRGDDGDTLVDENGVCDGKPDSGNKYVRARFGRRCTHNEELCVGSCGIILGRATFYDSEAPNGVRVSYWLSVQHHKI